MGRKEKRRGDKMYDTY